MTEQENRKESNQQSILEDLAVSEDKANEIKGGPEVITDAQALIFNAKRPGSEPAASSMQQTEQGVTGMFA